MYMFAYGSNLNLRQMERRCPGARPKGRLVVDDCALVFRGVADVTVKEGSTCEGGLWVITKECERALDNYEGVSGGLYIKRYFDIRINKQVKPCLVYLMKTRNGIYPPSEGYLQTIVQGYRDFGLDMACLDKALNESWERKAPTDSQRRRHEAKGRPALARDLIPYIGNHEDLGAANVPTHAERSRADDDRSREAAE